MRLATAILFITSAFPATAGEIASGRAIGEAVPEFHVRVVTGPLANKTVCYVCRNGSRPVVMVLLRRVEPELKPLLKNVDRLVDRHRADGLRGFGVLIDDESFSAISRVQTFGFEHQINLPLTVAGEAVALPSCQNIHADAAVTVVLYRDREVVERFAFRAGELTRDRAKEVLSAVQRLVASDS